jgi:hypothetical protein
MNFKTSTIVLVLSVVPGTATYPPTRSGVGDRVNLGFSVLVPSHFPLVCGDIVTLGHVSLHWVGNHRLKLGRLGLCDAVVTVCCRVRRLELETDRRRGRYTKATQKRGNRLTRSSSGFFGFVGSNCAAILLCQDGRFACNWKHPGKEENRQETGASSQLTHPVRCASPGKAVGSDSSLRSVRDQLRTPSFWVWYGGLCAL